MFITAYRAELANGLIENEHVHVFAGLFDGTPEPDPAEPPDMPPWAEPEPL